MRIGMIDDDQQFIQHFKTTYFSKLKILDQEVELITSTSLLPFNEIEAMDLLFLDIQLKDENGILFALKLREQLQSKLPLVFMSSKNELVFDTMATGPLYFIRKNNLQNDFELFLKLFKRNYQPSPTLTLPQNQVVKINEIIYITAYGHDLTIQTIKKQFLISGTMKKTMQQIPNPHFVQIQKSTTINLEKVTDVLKNTIIMSDGSQFEVSRLYKQPFLEKYKAFLLQ